MNVIWLELEAEMAALKGRSADFYWVGIYLWRGDALELGPYVGPKTDHVRILKGQGVCGTAVAQDRTIAVEDVRALDNYLACNLETRSELVVLLRGNDGKRLVGQIDIDSTRVGRFDPKTVAEVEVLAARLGPRVEVLLHQLASG